MSDITFDMTNNSMQVHHKHAEPWKVTLVDTGETTLTASRLKKVLAYIESEEAFCFTYGDGLSDIDVSEEIRFHKSHGRWATVTAVQPPGRYGALEMDNTSVTGFLEKPRGDGGLINGGFFILSPECLQLIGDGDNISWEDGPLIALAACDQLRAFKHDGFWHAVDTLRDKNYLNDLWQRDIARWKVW